MSFMIPILFLMITKYEQHFKYSNENFEEIATVKDLITVKFHYEWIPIFFVRDLFFSLIGRFVRNTKHVLFTWL